MSDNKKTKFRVTYILPAPKKVSYTYHEFYEEYYSPILKNAFRYTRNFHDAEEVTQEAMLRVLLRWSSIEMKYLTANVSLYCSHAHTDWFRVVQRNQADLRSFDEMFDPEQDYNHPEDTSADPMLELLSERASECMEVHLASLSEMDRKLFMMVYDEGIKTIFASEKLGITKGNADIRLYRARQKLSSCVTRDAIIEGVPNGAV